MTLNDGSKDNETILAVWPSYDAIFSGWVMQELTQTGGATPKWRTRRIIHPIGGITLDLYRDEEKAREMADAMNQACAIDLENRLLPADEKRSLQLKVSKNLQAKERLASEEKLMLAEAIRRHSNAPRVAGSIVLHAESEEYREELHRQLDEMPYLRVAIVGPPGARKILFGGLKGIWGAPYYPHKRSAEIAMRARIAGGFGLSGSSHWGKTKATIRQILLPRANQLLQLASVQRMLAEALSHGKHVLVCNGIVFWYEADGGIGWQVKSTSSTSESNASTLWKEGAILSKNHGRLVVLPYIKENGEGVSGHTKNGPNDGVAKPRHPDHYVEIPFELLDSDLMIGLYGELPYE
jgi:hypothetical protein